MPAAGPAAVGIDPVATLPPVDLLIAGLGPGGCAAALAAQALGLRTLAVDARGPEASRSQLVLVRPGAQAALMGLGLPDVSEGRRTTTIRHVENRLRAALAARCAAAQGASSLALHWHCAVAGLDVGADAVRVTLQDEPGGRQRQVLARHVIDASGGRLEALGRPVRERAGPGHMVITAEYETPPWFEGIVGVSDPRTHELYLLFPTWGRRGVIAYMDSLPGGAVDGAGLAQRFQAVAAALGLGAPLQPAWAVDVFQRGLLRAADDRVVPIGDAVGTVDVLLGAGMSTAIEDGADAVHALAAAQALGSAAAEMAATRRLGARLFARHRACMRRGRLLLLTRPILERAWPRAVLPDITRTVPGPPPLLWPAVRFVFGRRPQLS
jgi:2-polyprenyl-6-methoxyphenol hydroxylase-like FAD-dependent oxidoreductase